MAYICLMSKKITDQINKDFESTDDKVVINALGTVRQKGNKDNMPGIVRLLGHESEEVKQAATKVLFDLRDNEAIPALLDAFEASHDKNIRNIVLQSLWQSNIQPVNSLSRLVGIATKGSLEECIEVYSIVTNMIDVVIPDGEIMESLLLINNSVDNIKDKHQQQLIRDMAGFLQEQQELG